MSSYGSTAPKRTATPPTSSLASSLPIKPSSSAASLTPDDLVITTTVSPPPLSSVPGVAGGLPAGNIAGMGGAGLGAQPSVNTLDEPVLETLLRDLRRIWHKILQVLRPGSQPAADVLREWDLWGPLLLCLGLATRLSLTAPSDQSSNVFTQVFAAVWIGSAIVTLNAQLLGGRISFLQSVCVLSYCLFPLLAASVVSLLVPSIIIRGIFVAVAVWWSAVASLSFLSDARLENRRLLAVYPMMLFYVFLGWEVLISKSLFG
ncbi:Yip1-domain-containing protein [Gonapodya prolifera JEL478]|uniref:Protein YIP n=1 Tax=Gonapodya prolifera (strain JEL478) TaxID=1344416 RepID=A0A139AKN8_GONPJ|nr:Yip1-domain-containing protein [Gonapodya prolifera JEL478]|eukprot:KXS17361.1 Yip1-domain-containing protein [Gonapodya prolifera JEL478]